MFWFLDKKKNEAAIVGCVPILVKKTKYKGSRFVTHFTRNKYTKFEDEYFRIEKLPVERKESKLKKKNNGRRTQRKI